MNRPDGTRRALLAATLAAAPALVVAACAIQLRGDEDRGPMAASIAQSRDVVPVELERCRAVTAEQAAELQECRRIWAENRRRFLGQSKAPAAPSADAPPGTPGPWSAQPKDPGRVIWNWPTVATPKSE